jgi:hypothetical protein
MSENDKNENYNIHPYQTNNWVNISLENNRYRFLKDSRFGTGGYKNGTYLVPHKREDQNDYNLRRSKSFYNNQYSPILSAHYKPIFKNKALRKINEDAPQTFVDLYEVFLEDADGRGNSLQKTIEQAAANTKNLGASFLVMNNESEIDSSIEDVLESRSGVPYAFIITPDMVYTYSTDSFGNLTSLEWVQMDGELTYNNLGQLSTGDNAFQNGSSEAETIIVGVNAERWYTRDENGETTTIADNTIGEIPVVRLVEDETDDIIPEPSLYSVARIQHRIFNLDSIITDVSDNQGFSIFTMPSHPNSGVEFGTTKGISYPADSTNKPEFISPDAQQLKTLIDLENSLVNMCYQAGVVSHLQRFQQSAESKELDRARLNDLLGTFKYQIEQSETKLMDLFGLYVGYDYEYMVKYSDDYGVSTIAEQIDRFLSLDATRISETLFSALEKDLASNLLDFEDEDMKTEFLEMISEERKAKSDADALDRQF